MLVKRTNILFDPEMWRKLTELAKQQNTTIGELTRTAVQKAYFENEEYEKRKEATKKIKLLRKQIKGRFSAEVIKELINYGRKY